MIELLLLGYSIGYIDPFIRFIHPNIPFYIHYFLTLAMSTTIATRDHNLPIYVSSDSANTIIIRMNHMSIWLLHLLLLANVSYSSAFLNSFKSATRVCCRNNDANFLYANTQKQGKNDGNAQEESPFFFASVSNDNSTSAAGVVGTTAAAVGGAVVLSEGGKLSYHIRSSYFLLGFFSH